MMKAKKAPPLPEPDAYGNYWLGDPKPTTDGGMTRTGGPCVLMSVYVTRVRYFASLGDRVVGCGILCDGDGICYFDTPQEALAALREEWDRRTGRAPS